MLLTLPAYAMTVRTIIGHHTGFLLACAFPAVLWNVSAGQNGFLTATFLGGALGAMERRPLLAGVFLGLLSYKPQFGILFPLVLAVDRRWRVFWAAAITALGTAAASWLVFGSQTWEAFLYYLTLTNELVLGAGLADFHKLQSIFGAVRSFGGDETLAWTLQGGVIAGCALAVSHLWRRQVAYEVKAAALGAASLLATPYLYIYDLAALAVPMAFLVRLGFREHFLPYEPSGLALASVLILLFPLSGAPTGLLAVLIVVFLIVRRVLADATSATMFCPGTDGRRSGPVSAVAADAERKTRNLTQ
jgi:arabinofuranan 3-O-arabinosyltransferase